MEHEGRWHEAHRADKRRIRGWIALAGATMTAGVVADALRDDTGEALVFAVVGVSVLALAMVFVTRWSGWLRALTIRDYRRAAAMLMAAAAACLSAAAVLAERGLISPTVFTAVGLVAIVLAARAWLTASVMRRAAEAVAPDDVMAMCLGPRSPDGQLAVLVLTRRRLIAFLEVRLRGPLSLDAAEAMDVARITSAETRVHGRAIGLVINAGDHELALAKASPVQAREFVAAALAFHDRATAAS